MVCLHPQNDNLIKRVCVCVGVYEGGGISLIPVFLSVELPLRSLDAFSWPHPLTHKHTDVYVRVMEIFVFGQRFSSEVL